MEMYTELYAWIWKSFGKDCFSIDQFRSTFPTSQGPKIIHDLVKKGYLKRVKRSFYEVVEPEEFIDKITEEEKSLDILNKAEKDYALCESTAVSLWTDGYYWTGFTKGFRPVHVEIKKNERSYWRKFFKNLNAKYAFEGERRTLCGQVFVLHPKDKLKYVEKERLKVIPLEEAVAYCLRHELVYSPALEYLEHKYKIGYKGIR